MIVEDENIHYRDANSKITKAIYISPIETEIPQRQLKCVRTSVTTTRASSKALISENVSRGHRSAELKFDGGIVFV